MSMESEHRVIVIPPDGSWSSVVIRWPAGVVVLDGEPEDVRAALRSLRPDGELEPASGLLIERLRMLRLTDVAAGVSTPSGFRLFSGGRGHAGVEPSQPDAAQQGETSLTERDVALGASPIWIGMGLIDGTTLDAVGNHPELDLASGIVSGRGVALVRPLAAPTDPRPDPVAFDIVDFSREAIEAERTPLAIESSVGNEGSDGEPERGRDPIPLGGEPETVLGIACSRDHFNNPTAAYCQVCGISMVHVTHHLVRGERPTLGFLVFDDGATFALDRSYVIGREPAPDASGQFAPLAADDQEHTVSRSHAELTLDGWELLIADLGSTNGTFVWDAGRREWERVVPNKPVVVNPGASVAVGRKTFVYEPVARSV